MSRVVEVVVRIRWKDGRGRPRLIGKFMELPILPVVGDTLDLGVPRPGVWAADVTERHVLPAGTVPSIVLFVEPYEGSTHLDRAEVDKFVAAGWKKHREEGS